MKKTFPLRLKKKVKIESKYEFSEIKDIANFIGKGKRPASFVDDKGSFPFVGSSPTLKKCNAFDYDFEALLIGDGGTANIHYINGKFSASDHTYIITKKNVLLKYIYYFLSQNLSLLEQGFKGQSLKNISKSDVEALNVPVPPQELQAKIIDEMDNLKKQEDKIREEIQKLKNSFVELFQDENYTHKKLNNIVSFKNGLNYSRNSFGEVINIIGVRDFQNNFSPDIKSLEKVQIDRQLSEEYELKPKDILVVRSNGSANLVGRFLYIDDLLNGKISFSGFTIRIRSLNDEVNSKFLCHYLRTDIVRNELIGNSKGSNIKSLNQTLLSSIKIPVPSLREQQKIVAEIEKIESKISTLEKEIADLPKQKEAVLKRYL
ncbi:restriction endonuclease subunit S [Candidatus Glomeribacter gigasporarum]|uniref:restriction endonuclease subunit S n=1 Tax=Candidatus Glomeribacter gigasporarum TaxID=132144 RepID=UPI0002E9DDB3|nr:restriction endonuclease subunit S [Candidatus Glomeribacter gigasporarum]